MERVVFYSWLTGRPNNTNRSFIETALGKAAKAVASDDSVKIEPRIDQGAEGLGGTHDIAAAILDKIDKCDAFVCDMTFIGQLGERFVPNPNVLLEVHPGISWVHG
jgi:hypothetical protein